MDDSLLVCMLHTTANVDEQLQSLPSIEMVFVAVLRNGYALYEFHNEIRATRGTRPCIEHLGNVGMVHHRQRLPLRVKSCNDIFVVHVGPDKLQGNAAFDGLRLFGHIDNAHAAFTDLLKQFVRADLSPWIVDERGHINRRAKAGWRCIQMA